MSKDVTNSGLTFSQVRDRSKSISGGGGEEWVGWNRDGVGYQLNFSQVRDWSKSILGGWAGAEMVWVISFWALGKSRGHSIFSYSKGWVILVFLTGMWHTFDSNKNKWQTQTPTHSLASTLRMCTGPSPWQWQTWTAFFASSPWHSCWAEIGLRALCSLSFTAEASLKHPYSKAAASHNTCGRCCMRKVRYWPDHGSVCECVTCFNFIVC